MAGVINQQENHNRASWLKCVHQEIVQKREEALASDRTASTKGIIQEIMN
jgi:hypothetical protein